MFGLYKIEGILTAITPIFHGGNEKTGSVCLLNRINYIVDGEPTEVPYISGNAVRGVLRRYAFKDLLDAVGYEIDLTTKGGQKLYHALFSGGVLETVESTQGQIDIELKKRVYELIPPARLFGMCIGNQMIEGKLKVGHLLPVCVELKDYLPDYVNPKNSFYELIGRTYQTRKDELRQEREDDEQAVQMLVEYEVFIPGTQFYHKIMVEDPEEIDVSCLARVVELWMMKPFIGGKSSVGFGELDIAYKVGEEFSSNTYRDFLKEKGDEIVELLNDIVKSI